MSVKLGQLFFLATFQKLRHKAGNGEETHCPAWEQAWKAKAVAKWVLPVPELPISRTFSFLSMYSPRMSSRVNSWLIEAGP